MTAQRFYTGAWRARCSSAGEAVHLSPARNGHVPGADRLRLRDAVSRRAAPVAAAVHYRNRWQAGGVDRAGGVPFVLGDDGEFRFVDLNPRLWGCANAAVSARVDVYGGLARWIRDGTAGHPSRPLPGISHRVFPKYTFEPSGMSPWRRLTQACATRPGIPHHLSRAK